MYTPLPTPQEMAQWDKYAIEDIGIKGEILMENASREILHVLISQFKVLKDKKIILFAGSGNNGGDAFALARHLANHGAECTIFHNRKLDQYKAETAYHLQLTQKTDISFVYLPEFDLNHLPFADIIVDGILGTGFQGELKKDYQDLIEQINKLGKHSYILAIDIPSGLNGITGRANPIAIKADCTVTFQAAKLGLFMPEAADYVGDLHVREIGIPANVQKEYPPSCFGLDQNVFHFLPHINNKSHKGKAGHVLILGGSSGLTGATTLASIGAIRSGVGLVTVACPRSLSSDIKQGWPEIMTLPLGPGKNWSEACFAELEEHLNRFNAVVFGPGLGRQDGTREFLQAYLQSKHPPTVFDADALFWLAQSKELWKNLSEEHVLTPHPGEMGRLCDISIQEIQAERVKTAQTLATQIGCITVLKGAGSIITTPQAQTFVSPFSCANLAIGGSGDVLSGIIGALLSRGVPSAQAACLGVFWHGLAGKYLHQKYPIRGNMAQEIADALPHCYIELSDN